MENRPENYEELRSYKNRAWQAEGRIKTQRKQLRVMFALLLMLLLVLVVQNGSYGVTLRVLGLRETYVLVTGRRNFGGGGTFGITRRVSRWFGRNNEYRVIFSERQNGDAEFAALRRNRLGIWLVMRRVDERWLDSGGLEMFWFGRYSWNSYSRIANPMWEVHYFYFNTNAICEINIDDSLLPPNSAVFVRQTGSRYLLHFVSYGRPSVDSVIVDALLAGRVADSGAD